MGAGMPPPKRWRGRLRNGLTTLRAHAVGVSGTARVPGVLLICGAEELFVAVAISSIALTFRSGSPGLPAIVFTERPMYVDLVGCETTLRIATDISPVAFVRLDQ